MVSTKEDGSHPQLSEDELASQAADWEGMSQLGILVEVDEELAQALEEDLHDNLTPG